MKIVAISDIHGYFPEIPECDVVCICGDILPLHIQKDYAASVAWLAGPFQIWALNLKCKKVIFIAGNHDFIFEHMYKYGKQSSADGDTPTWKSGMSNWAIHDALFQFDDPNDPKLIYLCDAAYKYNDTLFYGTPWCPSLRNWAFYGDSDTLKSKFGLMPDTTDVLLTHCPPKYMGQGLVHETNWNYMQDFGCIELQDVIEDKFTEMKDMWVLSGHIHSGKHAIEKYNNIKYRNCSIKDENYEVSFEPFVFEI